eukprot:TRINITY_DN2581_c0_g1_i2.p1 TRINITY_DN2581_c0_g1~~TRINITY_DN2581_c0_g1_i2.p1  ORF type:complete len:153 (-),score=22.40 TRINITY_DN2581_c0_g1_i2:11-433(-)
MAEGNVYILRSWEGDDMNVGAGDLIELDKSQDKKEGFLYGKKITGESGYFPVDCAIGVDNNWVDMGLRNWERARAEWNKLDINQDVPTPKAKKPLSARQRKRMLSILYKDLTVNGGRLSSPTSLVDVLNVRNIIAFEEDW